MTQQNPNYHYNKARECLRRAESKDEGYTKDLQMAEAHMGIYRTLMEEMRKNQELWNRMPYRSSPTPWMTTYAGTTNLSNASQTGLDES